MCRDNLSSFEEKKKISRKGKKKFFKKIYLRFSFSIIKKIQKKIYNPNNLIKSINEKNLKNSSLKNEEEKYLYLNIYFHSINLLHTL